MVVVVAFVDAQDFNMDDMMNKNCPNFKCSAGYTPVPKSRTKFESTGCSTMGVGMVSMNAGGDGDEAAPYESCCHQWHACYQICGMAKKTCDDTFETCAKKACGEDDEKCNKDISLNLMMMKLAGCKKFDESQYQVCECAPKDKADSKREAAIRNFYKKNSPENVDKAKDLVAKAETTSKMAGLFQKLLLKYPDAIVIKENPMKAMFDKIKMETPESTSEEESDGVDDEPIPADEKIEL